MQFLALDLKVWILQERWKSEILKVWWKIKYSWVVYFKYQTKIIIAKYYYSLVIEMAMYQSELWWYFEYTDLIKILFV